MGWNNISDANNHKIFDKVDKEQGFSETGYRISININEEAG